MKFLKLSRRETVAGAILLSAVLFRSRTTPLFHAHTLSPEIEVNILPNDTPQGETKKPRKWLGEVELPHNENPLLTRYQPTEADPNTDLIFWLTVIGFFIPFVSFYAYYLATLAVERAEAGYFIETADLMHSHQIAQFVSMFQIGCLLLALMWWVGGFTPLFRV